MKKRSGAAGRSTGAGWLMRGRVMMQPLQPKRYQGAPAKLRLRSSQMCVSAVAQSELDGSMTQPKPLRMHGFQQCPRYSHLYKRLMATRPPSNISYSVRFRTYKNRPGAGELSHGRAYQAAGSCAGLNGRPNDRLRPRNALGPLLREPGYDFIVFSGGEGLFVVVQPVKETPIASGQAPQRRQADRSRGGVCRGARHEI